jgi:hypothetical protein
MINDITLIPLTVHGVPSGNYDGSSTDWLSNPIKAANYYRGHGFIQVVWFNVENFQGQITIQATLDRSPGSVVNAYSDGSTINWAAPDPVSTDLQIESGWFTVAEFGDLSSQITDYRPLTVNGNFTWLRARIQGFDAGTIKRVNVTY